MISGRDIFVIGGELYNSEREGICARGLNLPEDRFREQATEREPMNGRVVGIFMYRSRSGYDSSPSLSKEILKDGT